MLTSDATIRLGGAPLLGSTNATAPGVVAPTATLHLNVPLVVRRSVVKVHSRSPIQAFRERVGSERLFCHGHRGAMNSESNEREGKQKSFDDGVHPEIVTVFQYDRGNWLANFMDGVVVLFQ